MTTYRPITQLPAPVGDAPISKGVLAYLRARYRSNVHSIILEELENSGLTNAQIARRLRMDPAQLARLLGHPSNMTEDTICDLLFAIAGKEPCTKALLPGEAEEIRNREDRMRGLFIAVADLTPIWRGGRVAIGHVSTSAQEVEASTVYRWADVTSTPADAEETEEIITFDDKQNRSVFLATKREMEQAVA